MYDINNYIFSKDDTIGKGSFSKVYLGKNIINNKKVAIKIINIHKCNKILDINKEINILKSIDHINIVNLEESIINNNKLYIVLEYCPLGDLNKFFNKVAVKEIYVKYYAKQIIDGLLYLSSKNIMHRDIKPHNILLKNIYTIKLTDFGFAKYYDNTIDMSTTLCGSPIYMAPEIMKLKTYNYKADIWSLGVVLYELLFNEYPFIARNHFELVKIIEQNEVKFLDYPIISDDCKKFISLLLNKNPIKRPSYYDIINHSWLINNSSIKKLKESSTYQLYNEFIVNDSSSCESISDNNSCTSSRSNNNNEIFEFDDEDNFKTIELSKNDDYVIVDNNDHNDINITKTTVLTYSFHDIYQKFIDNYFK